MNIRYPAALRTGSCIGVTSPSSGVPARLRPRLRYAASMLRAEGYDVVVGRCMDGDGIVSASAPERAAELTRMLTDPRIAAVIPPWGGEIGIDVLPHLDFDAIQAAEPTWLIGYSDISTLLLPITARTGTATIHGNNLMDTPYAVPAPLLSWRDVAVQPPGGSFVQGPAARVRLQGFDDYAANPRVTEYTFDSPGGWQLLEPSSAPVEATGRLIGGCLETVAMLAGTGFADMEEFAGSAAPEGLLLYLEAAESDASAVARYLFHLRLAGWFTHARAILIGRTRGGPSGGFSQLDALRSALSGLDVPVIYDVDCGHVPRHLAILNGAVGTVRLDESGASLTQKMI